MTRNFFRTGKIFAYARHKFTAKPFLVSFPALLLSGTSYAAVLPATNQALSNSDMSAMMPLAITGGIGLFAILACAMWLQAVRKSSDITFHASHEVGAMRATLDHAEALLSGMDKLIITWPPSVTQSDDQEARIFGALNALENAGLSRTSVLDFGTWLPSGNTRILEKSISRLKVDGTNFSTQLTTIAGFIVHVDGRLTGGTPMLRFSDVLSDYEKQKIQGEFQTEEENHIEIDTSSDFWAIADGLTMPVWTLAKNGLLLGANAAYLNAVGADTLLQAIESNAEFLPVKTLERTLFSRNEAGDNQGGIRRGNMVRSENGREIKYDVTANNTDRETLYTATVHSHPTQPISAAAHNVDQMLSAAIAHLTTPTAMFDHDRALIHFNRAFVELWELDENWLKDGPNEMAVLDRLRTEGKLPNEVDYRAWRDQHLRSYHTDEPSDQLWYLPNGITLKVVATPTAERGVTYTYENVTGQYELESRYKTLTRVQGETLAHLSEGVVVFGTNGRLDLHNPVFARQWHISTNLLSSVPHIDEIIAECAQKFGPEARGIWDELRRQVISLGENRQRQSGRISRSDNSLYDYIIVPLPDGKTMMNFVEVTASANLEKALKERNDALEMADRLKDDFIQHVSYELRTPLTNIIGFSDMLNDADIGPLNAKQREYASFIRSSSSSLKILVDHILDLANIDAGAADLNLSDVDIAAVIDEARTGVESKFAENLSDKKINLTVTIEEGLEVFTADHARMVQILYNLLSNAAVYSDSGDGIELNCFDSGDDIVFSVTDHGEGIPEDMTASIFDLFQGRGKNGNKRGAGLGLSIVRAFVELHGGKATILSRKGQDGEQRGMQVEVRIPKSLTDIKDTAIASGAA